VLLFQNTKINKVSLKRNYFIEFRSSTKMAYNEQGFVAGVGLEFGLPETAAELRYKNDVKN
jgi:hypothetical protein